MMITPSLGFGDNSSSVLSVTAGENDPAVPMKLVVRGDYAGFQPKRPLVKFLQSQNKIIKDVGSFTPDPIDFPDKYYHNNTPGKDSRNLSFISYCFRYIA